MKIFLTVNFNVWTDSLVGSPNVNFDFDLNAKIEQNSMKITRKYVVGSQFKFYTAKNSPLRTLGAG